MNVTHSLTFGRWAALGPSENRAQVSNLHSNPSSTACLAIGFRPPTSSKLEAGYIPPPVVVWQSSPRLDTASANASEESCSLIPALRAPYQVHLVVLRLNNCPLMEQMFIFCTFENTVMAHTANFQLMEATLGKCYARKLIRVFNRHDAPANGLIKQQCQDEVDDL
jgi:hypothetical protein